MTNIGGEWAGLLVHFLIQYASQSEVRMRTAARLNLKKGCILIGIWENHLCLGDVHHPEL